MQTKRATERLTCPFIRAVSRPGAYGDGGRGSYGLHLVVTPTAKCFRQRLYYNGRVHNLGLGGWPDVSLDAARQKAIANRQIVRAGGDPMAAKRLPKVPTFAEAAEAAIEMLRPTWKPSSNSESAWRSSLRTYAYPKIGGLRIDAIEVGHLKGVLAPIWNEKRTTALHLKQRLGVILTFAISEGHRTDNPIEAAVAGLPKARAVKVQHHAALHYSEVAAAVAKVKAAKVNDSIKQAFEFMVLTGCRSGEVRGARWSEIDLKAALWVVPAARMKAEKEHPVPLSDRAIAVLKEARTRHKGDLVFPNAKGTALSDYHLGARLLPKLGIAATAHGFRSSFRDWAGELSGAAHAVCEAAIAHTINNKAEAAYHRTNYLEQRRELMQAWAHYLGDQGGKVVKLAARR